MPKSVMPSGAKKRKVSEAKRKSLAVLAESRQLNHFFQQNFQAAKLKQWR